MTEPYTPSVDEVREAYKGDERYDESRGPEFDCWLSSHEEAVRAEERARIEAESTGWQYRTEYGRVLRRRMGAWEDVTEEESDD